MTTREGDRNEWLQLLLAEQVRRTARVEWEAGEPERATARFLTELDEMAARLVAAGSHYVPRLDDMSPAEMLACHLTPVEFHPAGLPTIEAIWGMYRARKAGCITG